MSITSYAELQTAVINWLNNDSLTGFVPDFITLAEARIYRELRVRHMEKAFSGAIASSVFSIPSDYKKVKHIRVSGKSRLLIKDDEFIRHKYPVETGLPIYVAEEGTNFIFGPAPDSDYNILGIYYAKLTALSGSNPSNWLITENPDLILFAALCEATPFLQNDARIIVWEAKYKNAKDMIQRESNEWGGNSLQVTNA